MGQGKERRHWASWENVGLPLNTHTQYLSFYSLLPSLPHSLQEAAWTISNITAGQPHQIQAVVDAGLIPPVIDILVKVRRAILPTKK